MCSNHVPYAKTLLAPMTSTQSTPHNRPRLPNKRAGQYAAPAQGAGGVELRLLVIVALQGETKVINACFRHTEITGHQLRRVAQALLGQKWAKAR